MNVDGVPHRTIALSPDGDGVDVLDQTVLPHRFSIVRLRTLAEAADAISRMVVRGAPLIGVTAAYGLWLGLRQDPSDAGLAMASKKLAATRPTAVNLRWALRDLEARLAPIEPVRRASAALSRANEMAEEDVAVNRAIGRHGLTLLRRAYEAGGRKGPVRVLTHCNAGWLATVDVGTALAPVYAAFDEGLPVHVYADETRPRGQGARLTAWELSKHGVPVTVVADTAAGHLLQRGRIDLCIVGTDRVAANGDVANKIGTYLVALAARDSGVPFHVALPGSTIDADIADGVAKIPIEERSAREVTHVAGRDAAGLPGEVEVTPAGTSALNPAFDVTPARLVTSFITERGICAASREGLAGLFPEKLARGTKAATGASS